MAHAADRGLVWIRRWRGAVSGVSCQFRIVGNVHFLPCVSNLSKNRMKAVFDLKFMLAWVSIKWCLTRVGSGSALQTRIGSGISYPKYCWCAPLCWSRAEKRQC